MKNLPEPPPLRLCPRPEGPGLQDPHPVFRILKFLKFLKILKMKTLPGPPSPQTLASGLRTLGLMTRTSLTSGTPAQTRPPSLRVGRRSLHSDSPPKSAGPGSRDPHHVFIFRIFKILKDFKIFKIFKNFENF